MNVAPPESAARPAAIPATPPPSAAPAASSWIEDVNLARRPFGNSRPVVRASLLLWLLGAALLAANVSSFWTYLVASEDKRAQLDRGDQEIQTQQGKVRELDQRLARFDLKQMNDQIEFLNSKIAERTFSWSQLLAHVARALPNDVRLIRLSPLTGAKAGQSRTGRTTTRKGALREGEVTLTMTGETRDDEELLRFVDNLFAPPFRDPNLIRESREEDSDRVSFEVTVQYRAAPPQESQGEIVEEAPAPPSSAEEQR
jgi:hypothetical protein